MAAYMISESEEENVAALLVLNDFFESDEEEEGYKRQRRTTELYIKNRVYFGAYHKLMQEMADQDPTRLRKFLRMSGETFDELLQKVAPYIEKQDTNWGMAIPAAERLAVTLRFLAQGGTYLSMFSLFLIPEKTLGYLIPETCDGIYQALKADHMKTPKTEAEWKEVQTNFYKKWNFPQCLGAMDGKHVRIKCPPNGGSAYYNYQGYHSIVLFAIVDATYKFIYHEVGAEGRTGDATIWNESNFKDCLERGLWNTPPPLLAPRSQTAIPSLIVADSAFALAPQLMKPYPERDLTYTRRVFNYHLSRARRIVENAFGILACRFGIFQSTIMQHPTSARKFVLAALALHNYLRDKKDQQYCGPCAMDYEQGIDHILVQGQWRQVPQARLHGLQNGVGGAQHQHASGAEVRDTLKEYFMNDGAVPWQATRAYTC